MSNGLLISMFNRRQAEAIAKSIHYRDSFTATVPIAIQPKSAELVAISLSLGKIDFLGICVTGGRVATAVRKMTVSNLVPIAGLSLATIQQELPKRFRTNATSQESEFTRIPPRTWEEMLKAIARLCSNPELDIPALQKKAHIAGLKWPRMAGGLEALERDAVATAVEAWGGSGLRRRVLQEASESSRGVSAPFLSRIRNAVVREDVEINHDQISLPGFTIRPGDIAGLVELYGENGKLTVLNCNRQPLEQTLGVDLIYYHHSFDSFVLLQYKRMKRASHGQLCYYPDSDGNHDKEMSLMAKAETFIDQQSLPQPPTTASFCLSDSPFFIKLCEPTMPRPMSPGLVPGMYLPFRLWQVFLNSDAAQGSKGGRVVSRENCSRKLTNTEFAALLRNGWIGSAPGASSVLHEIVGTVLQDGHMLVLAIASDGDSSMDYRRNSLGQFASQEDPDGAF